MIRRRPADCRSGGKRPQATIQDRTSVPRAVAQTFCLCAEPNRRLSRVSKSPAQPKRLDQSEPAASDLSLSQDSRTISNEPLVIRKLHGTTTMLLKPALLALFTAAVLSASVHSAHAEVRIEKN